MEEEARANGGRAGECFAIDLATIVVVPVSIDRDPGGSRGSADTLSTRALGLLMIPASWAMARAVRAKSPVTLLVLEIRSHNGYMMKVMMS